MTPRRRYDDNRELIDDVIEKAIGSYRLGAGEGAELRSYVHLRLLKDDCAILAKFTGNSRLRTFLNTVIRRMVADHRNESWGRFRTSAAADRLGLPGQLLETYVYRDKFSFDEAKELVRQQLPTPPSDDEFEEMLIKLAGRKERTSELGGDPDGFAFDPEGHFAPEHRILEARARELGKALELFVSQLSESDALILRLSYEEALTAPEIATIMGIDQRRVYRKRDRTRRQLRDQLIAAGFTPEEVSSLSTPEFEFS